MPTLTTAEPKAPGEKRTPSEAVAFGRIQWTSKFRAFASQWTQPQLMKLATATLGENCLHSSQIHGFTTGKLRDPAPKVLMVIGELNAAIAKANGEDIEALHIPETLSTLYKGHRWMTTADGEVMGPLEVFQAVTGLIDLGTDAKVDINKKNVEAVAKSLGKFMRLKAMEFNMDWMDEDHGPDPSTPEGDYLLRLYGNRKVQAPEILEHIELCAQVARCTPADVVDLAIRPVL